MQQWQEHENDNQRQRVLSVESGNTELTEENNFHNADDMLIKVSKSLHGWLQTHGFAGYLWVVDAEPHL